MILLLCLRLFLNFLCTAEKKKSKKDKKDKPESEESHVDFMIQPEKTTPKIDTSKYESALFL